MVRLNAIMGLILFVSSFGFTFHEPTDKFSLSNLPDSTIVISHLFEDDTDSLSGPEIYEWTDPNGVSILFGRFIYKEVCLSGECKMVKLWIFWNGVGNFLGLKIPPNEELTKSDHIPFESADYLKLHNILKDTSSILKNLSQKELLVSSDTSEPTHVDAITSATSPILSDILVNDAAFTCHTLWHTVYGPVQKEIFRIIQSKVNFKYLTFLFHSKNQEYIFWGLDQLTKKPQYYQRLQPQIYNLIKDENREVAFEALTCLNTHVENESLRQKIFIDLLPDVQKNIRYEMLWILVSQGSVSDTTLLNLLIMFETGAFDPGHLRLIYDIVRKNQLKGNDEIRQQVFNFLDHDNDYVRMISLQLLRNNSIEVSGQD